MTDTAAAHMSDDELLALAVKARDCYGGGAPWERYFAAVTNPAAIIAMHERYRAEVERLEAAMGKLHADLYGMQDGALLRDLQTEAERLTARIDELEYHLDVVAKAHLLTMDRALAAESALAAAQKRVGELEGRVNNVIREYEAARITDNELATKLVRLAHGTERAALDGPKESDNG